MDKKLEFILPKVNKPARYTGGEFGQVIKNKSEMNTRFVFCFPDTYEIGMSNLGMHILYGALNAIPDVWCERSFTPWVDMEREMRNENIPLFALESGDPLKQFDFIGFSVQYELSYTNILTMLDMGGVEIFAKERKNNAPLVIGGGCCTYNSEPFAEIFDLIVIGEGEEVLIEIVELYKKHKSNFDRNEFLLQAAQIEGVYVPKFYEFSYEDGKISSLTVAEGVPKKIVKRYIKDLDKSYYPIIANRSG